MKCFNNIIKIVLPYRHNVFDISPIIQPRATRVLNLEMSKLPRATYRIHTPRQPLARVHPAGIDYCQGQGVDLASVYTAM